MIYEIEPENSYVHTADSRFITAAAYLKGLHHNDKPTELMPKDALYLNSARRFYNSLSNEDRIIIDSYSNCLLSESLNLKIRNRRFNELTHMFLCQLGSITINSTFLPLK